MIKKILTIIICLTICQTVFSEQILFLDGIHSSMELLYSKEETANFTGQNTSNTDTKTIIKDMVKGYEDLDDDKNPDTDQILICHSQGGLRALAYAEELHKQGKNNRVKAIVTIGSPIKGEHALLYGGAHLNNRLTNRIDNIVKTGKYTAAPIIAVCLITTALADAFGGTSYTSDLNKMLTTESIINTILGSVENDDSGAVDFIKKAFNDPNIGFNKGALEAMTPRSNFQKNYISPDYNLKIKLPYFVRRLTGYKIVNKIVGWKWIIPIIKTTKVPVYRTYLVCPPPTIEATKRLTDKQLIGHVTGGGSNAPGSDILQMIEDATKGKDGAITKQEVEGWINTAETISNVTGTVYAAQAAVLVAGGFSNFGIGFIAAIPFSIAADNCFDTGSFFSDFNTNFSKEMYLTTAHDGFVNTSSMVYPSGNAHQWIRNNNRDMSIKDFPELNHLTERTSPKVWGDGSFDSATIGDSGAVNDLIKRHTSLRNGGRGY